MERIVAEIASTDTVAVTTAFTFTRIGYPPEVLARSPAAFACVRPLR
jgi:hypothetical protein